MEREGREGEGEEGGRGRGGKEREVCEIEEGVREREGSEVCVGEGGEWGRGRFVMEREGSEQCVGR